MSKPALKAKVFLGISFILSLSLNALPTLGSKMLVATNSKLATDVGEVILSQGGNVVDVAVATGIALAVVSPYYGSFGGGGFAMIKMGSILEALDFREKAPGKASPEIYESNKEISPLNGGAASGVPGIVAGYFAMHKKYGKLPWKNLFYPSIRLAKQGFRLSGEFVSSTARGREFFNERAKQLFLARNGNARKPGEIFKYPSLVPVLEQIQRDPKNFYRGTIASDIVTSVNDTKGFLSLKDLADYKVRWLTPLRVTAFGYDFNLMPPPSSGGIVLGQIIKALEKVELQKLKPLSSEELHLLAEVEKGAYRYRSLLGDPAFTKAPLVNLADSKLADEIAKGVSTSRISKLTPIDEDKYWNESSETTSLSVMDANGNGVAMTITLNRNFGSGVSTIKFAIPMNNQMDDFTTSKAPNLYGLVQGKANLVQAGKTPLSSMSPTIVEKDGKTSLVLGGLGGPRIITGVLQTIYRRLVNQWDIDQAVQAPRVHHQFLPNEIFVDENRFSEDTLRALQKIGHKTTPSWMARIFAISLNDEVLSAAGDARGEMGISGY